MAEAATDGPLFLVVKIFPRLDKLAEAEAQLKSMIANNLTEDGCLSMHLVQEEGDDSHTWTMLEHFASKSAWENEHMASDHNQQGNELLEPLLRQPSELGLYREV